MDIPRSVFLELSTIGVHVWCTCIIGFDSLVKCNVHDSFSCLNKSATPVACESGFYSPSGEMTCKECRPGYMCPTPEPISIPIPCINGTYSNSTRSTSCKVCPVGYSCLDPGQTPVLCQQGFYSPSGTAQCLICPAGHR